MRARSAQKITLTPYDKLFESAEPVDGGAEQICFLPINRLHCFPNHPFHVIDDERMQEMVESIQMYGVLVPAIFREDGHNGYEIIAGHRRKRGCELAGLTEMPAVIRNMSDDEASIAMVDSNIQRESILPSEKAWAYRIKQEALNHQGIKDGRISADLVGEAAGDSRRTVYRYIRLTYLNNELMDWVDKGNITVVAGEILSGLNKERQDILADVIRESGRYPSKEESGDILRADDGNGLIREQIIDILGNRKKNRDSGITLPIGRVRGYFPEGYTRCQMEEIIYQLLDSWKAGRAKE